MQDACAFEADHAKQHGALRHQPGKALAPSPPGKDRTLVRLNSPWQNPTLIRLKNATSEEKRWAKQAK